MTTQTKTKIVALLGDASLLLSVAAALPYSLGEAANVLPPEAKKWVTLITLGTAAATKFVQRAIEIFTAHNEPPTP